MVVRFWGQSPRAFFPGAAAICFPALEGFPHMSDHIRNTLFADGQAPVRHVWRLPNRFAAVVNHVVKVIHGELIHRHLGMNGGFGFQTRCRRAIAFSLGAMTLRTVFFINNLAAFGSAFLKYSLFQGS